MATESPARKNHRLAFPSFPFFFFHLCVEEDWFDEGNVYVYVAG